MDISPHPPSSSSVASMLLDGFRPPPSMEHLSSKQPTPAPPDAQQQGPEALSPLVQPKPETPQNASNLLSTGPFGRTGTPMLRPGSKLGGSSSRRGTPKSATPAPPPKMSPSRPTTGEGNMVIAAAQVQNHQQPGGRSPDPSNNGRPLNVTDALSYLDAVKIQFQDKPDVYNRFLDIMKDFKSQVIDTPGVIERVSMLFHGNSDLIQGFNTFLPPGYRIEVSNDPNEPNLITVTTPSGTTTQTSGGMGLLQDRDVVALGPHTMGQGFAGSSNPPYSSSPPPPLGSRPPNPQTQPYQPQMSAPFDNMSTGLNSPAFHPLGASTNAAATFLGGLSTAHARSQGQMEPNRTQIEFNHAIHYLNKIKARYADDTNSYKQFLEILQTYQKEQTKLEDSQVYVQVQMLFKDAPDLLTEFKEFLPPVVAPSAHNGGVVGILPQPPAAHGPDSQSSAWKDDAATPGRAEKVTKKAAAPVKRRKRAAEPEPVPPPPAKASTSHRSKKVKHSHKPEASSPPYSPYTQPVSPPPTHIQSQGLAPPSQVPNQSHSTLPPEDAFFEKVKRALDSRETYDEFLKLVNLFTTEVIDTKVLLEQAVHYLGDGELLHTFKELLGWDDRPYNREMGPPGSVRTGPPEAITTLPAEDGTSPSYRRLPESEIRLACSGRDQLCRSVLNDEWVSHPMWASEEAGFVTHKKNQFEDALHKTEEERHDVHVWIEGMARTIAVYDTINARINEMTPEERSTFRLDSDLGGPSTQIYIRTLVKIYEKDNAKEVIQALQDCPSVAVPVVLARLKAKNDEWRRAEREWSRTWNEYDAKNFYKGLDYQCLPFKQTDKKSITMKSFVTEIEGIRKEREKEWRLKNDSRFLFARGSLGPQITLKFKDTSVVHDVLKLAYSFLDHLQGTYNFEERRAIERFLRGFMPSLFMVPQAEFDAACGPVDPHAVPAADPNLNAQEKEKQASGVPANDLRKKLLKTQQEKSSRDKSMSKSRTGSATPGGTNSPRSRAKDNEEVVEPAVVGGDLFEEEGDMWIREAVQDPPPPLEDRQQARDINDDSGGMEVDGGEPRRPVFLNSTFYTLLRLFHVLYTRISTLKEIGTKLAQSRHAPLKPNPIALELGLEESNGMTSVLTTMMDAFGMGPEANVVYAYLLDSCEKLFDNEMDQATFEEHMRWFFGTKAYLVFTLDKVLFAFLKQAQQVIAENRCLDLWSLMKTARSAEAEAKGLTNKEKIRYRREAENHVSSDEHLYRVEWVPAAASMRIQLLGADDPSVDEGAGSAVARWREYGDTYVLRHATEWVGGMKGAVAPFLRRTLPAEEGANTAGAAVEDLGGGAGAGADARREETLAVRVSLGTYKLFYESGTEDTFWRVHSRSTLEVLRERAQARDEDRRRSGFLI